MAGSEFLVQSDHAHNRDNKQLLWCPIYFSYSNSFCQLPLWLQCPHLTPTEIGNQLLPAALNLSQSVQWASRGCSKKDSNQPFPSWNLGFVSSVIYPEWQDGNPCCVSVSEISMQKLLVCCHGWIIKKNKNSTIIMEICGGQRRVLCPVI